MDFSKIIPAYLVGNKCDMEHEIPDEEIEKFKNANKLYGYISTSTKDNIGIDKLLEAVPLPQAVVVTVEPEIFEENNRRARGGEVYSSRDEQLPCLQGAEILQKDRP